MSEKTQGAIRESRNAIRRLLWHWGTTSMRIKKLEAERAAFWEMANDARRTLRSPSLTGMPRGGKTSDLSDVTLKIIDAAERYAKQAQKIDAEIDDAIRMRNCISDCVTQLSPLQEKVLIYRYVDGHSWRYIAMKLTYDERHVRRVEESAMDAIARMIEIHTS